VREKISSSLAAMNQPTPATTELPALPGDTTVAFGVADIIVVVFYFAFVLTVGIWVSPQGNWVWVCLRWKAFGPLWIPPGYKGVCLQRASPAHTVIPGPIEQFGGDSDLPVSPHPLMGTTKCLFPGGCAGGDVYLPCFKVVSYQGVGGQRVKEKPGLVWGRLK